ncbi:MAG: hypothetical protein ACYC69_02455 [Thermodesulfovibrionales bacterium]
MIALALLGIAVVAIFQLFSITMRSTKKAGDYTMALLYARSLLDEAYSVRDPSAEPVRITFEKGYRGSREVTLQPATDKKGLKVYEITAIVTWPPSGDLRLRGLRTVYEPEE